MTTATRPSRWPSTPMRPARRIGATVLGALLGAALVARPAPAQQIYFADLFNPTFDDGFVRRVSAAGTGLETLVTAGGGLRGLAVDASHGKMYWCDVLAYAIRRANLDGSGQEDIVTTGLQFPSVIKADPAGGHIYWGDQLSDEIWRADLDGTNAAPLLSTAFHRGIALDTAGGKLYWSTSITMFRGDIRRANLDGTGQEIVVSTTLPEFKPSAIALDIPRGKIYWTDYVVDVVQRANLDGSSIETLFVVGANMNPGGIALDLDRGKVYWGQDDDVSLHIASIRRMDLDGANPGVVISGLGSVNDLGLVDDACYPDCDTNGALNINDYICFQTRFALGDPYADCDGNGVRDVNDYICYQTRFALGCA